MDMQIHMMNLAAKEAEARGVLMLTTTEWANMGTIYIKSHDGIKTLSVVGFRFDAKRVSLTPQGIKAPPSIDYANDLEMARFLPTIFAGCPAATSVGRAAAERRARATTKRAAK